MLRVPLIAGCLIATLLPSAALAQTLYKSTMPDGKVIYSDKPALDAVKVEESSLDTSKKGVVPPSAKEKAVLKQMTQERQAREAKDDRVRRAELTLHQAEVAQGMGKEPQPNERQGTATGAQRFTDGYWQRQKKLEQDVENARRALEQARSAK